MSELSIQENGIKGLKGVTFSKWAGGRGEGGGAGDAEDRQT